MWPHRRDFLALAVEVGGGRGGRSATASIDWRAALAGLDAGRLPCSGGEERLLRLAASLAVGITVDLLDALSGLDERNAALVVAAVGHATGHGDHLGRGGPVARW